MPNDDLTRQIDKLSDGDSWEIKHRFEVHRQHKDGEEQDVHLRMLLRLLDERTVLASLRS